MQFNPHTTFEAALILSIPQGRIPMGRLLDSATTSPSPQPALLRIGVSAIKKALSSTLRAFSWQQLESNQRHQHFQCCALPTELCCRFPAAKVRFGDRKGTKPKQCRKNYSKKSVGLREFPGKVFGMPSILQPQTFPLPYLYPHVGANHFLSAASGSIRPFRMANPKNPR